MGRWIYSLLIPPPRLRLRLPTPVSPPFLFLGRAFLIVPFVAFLRGVPALDFAEEILKWPVVPEALAVLRILKIRSDIARGVGRSRPIAEARY